MTVVILVYEISQKPNTLEIFNSIVIQPIDLKGFLGGNLQVHKYRLVGVIGQGNVHIARV